MRLDEAVAVKAGATDVAAVYAGSEQIWPSGFNPETDITWHSLFWTEGSSFQAQGYSDTDTVINWPNETGESDADNYVITPAFDASTVAFNNAPTISYAGNTLTKHQTDPFSVNPSSPYSIVCIGAAANVSYATLVDGVGASNRNIVRRYSLQPEWQIYAGSAPTGGTFDTNPHLFVSYWNTGGDETLSVDGVVVINTAAGSQALTGLTIGGPLTGAYSCQGNIALVGLYEGDITADVAWADFVAWVESHYGLSIA